MLSLTTLSRACWMHAKVPSLMGLLTVLDGRQRVRAMHVFIGEEPLWRSGTRECPFRHSSATCLEAWLVWAQGKCKFGALVF
jgi:hypothetical protein